MKTRICSCQAEPASTSFTSYFDAAQLARKATTATLLSAVRRPMLPRTIRDLRLSPASWRTRKHSAKTAGKPVLAPDERTPRLRASSVQPARGPAGLLVEAAEHVVRIHPRLGRLVVAAVPG